MEPIVSKPASGHWTHAYPELGTGPVSFDDCVSEEFYELEREHIFKKCWLYVGRMEQLPQRGSYFTRELQVLGTSLIIVRGKDDVVRALHNICPHRGNKLVWHDDPFQETHGTSPVFFCRFHGWSYGLDGALLKPSRKDLLLEPIDPAQCRVPAIQCEVWQGFIFINMNPENREPLREFLGELAHGVEGYPFDGPHQVYRFKADLKCNWKIYVDGFAESYHGPYLHAASFGTLTAAARDAFDKPNPFTDVLGFQLKGPHRMFSFAGEPSRKTPYSKPIECLMQASAAGPWNKKPDTRPRPPGLNPTRAERYGFDSFQFFPNFVLIFSASGYSLHAHWPTGPHSHLFEAEMYFRPPTTHRERLAQELTITYLNDILLEDASPSEGLQSMLNSRALRSFYLNDEELLVRHLHKVVGDYVAEGERRKAAR